MNTAGYAVPTLLSEKKSKDKFSPDYVPTIFTHAVSPLKRKAQVNLERYERRKNLKGLV